MPALELKFLGDVEVIRDGNPLALPPSKKTRALLAYLALMSRPARRDQLCELLWELPDDPRGSLRWSLSKLRRLVDEEGCRRIIADRTQVSFDSTGVAIDVLELRELVQAGLEHASTELLEAAAIDYQDNFLEGLELTQLHGFYAWCVAEREQVVRDQAAVLEALVDRFQAEPERALPHARALVARSPYSEEIRARLIRMLVNAGRGDEAEQQFQMGERLLTEIGATSRGLLSEARHELPSTPAGDSGTGSGPAPTSSLVPPNESWGSSADSADAERLIGRDQETERLESALARVVRESRTRFVLLQGDAGMGKTRLLESMSQMARNHGAFLLEASAFESETIRPFALWIDALRRLSPDTARAVFGEQERGDRDQLFGGLTEIIARESESKPVVLLFDDLQWCDESSSAALHYIARMNRGRPLLGVLAAREADLNDNAAAQQAIRGLRRDRLLEDLRLGPLPDAAIEALISEHSSGIEAVVGSAECQGNPLLAIELARSATSGDESGSLRELVRERLARLDLDGADVIRWAALLAPQFELATLVRIAGVDPARVGEILERAEQLALLRPSEQGFRFSHDLIVRCIYGDISPARRSVMHGRVADLLEQDAAVDLDRAADLAHHASLSGDSARAARAMVFAGKLCLRFFANEEAISLVNRGLKWVMDLPDSERVPLTIELQDIALAAAPLDDWDAAAKEYVSLAEQALDYGALSHARLGYQMASYVRWAHGQWEHAREETLQAERVTRGGSEEDHIIGMAETAKCLAMLERDLSQADAMLMEVQALALRNRIRHHSIPAAQGMLHFHRNELGDAEDRFLEARTLCKSAGVRVDEFQAIEYLVMLDLERGRLASARSRCDHLVELGEKIRVGSEAPFARALLGLCDYSDGEAASVLDAALHELRSADAKHRLAYVLTRAAILDLEKGQPAEAIGRAQEALDCAEALERSTDMLLAHAALSAAYRAAGDPSLAARHRDALERIEPGSVARWASDRVSSLSDPVVPG